MYLITPTVNRILVYNVFANIKCSGFTFHASNCGNTFKFYMKKQNINYWFSRQPVLSVSDIINRKRWGSTLLALIPLLFSGTNSAADNSDVLTLNTTTKPPLSTPDQQGFLDKVATNALSRIGLKLKIMSLPAERALIDANAGVLDGELARVPGIEKTYGNLLFVPENLMDVEFTIFSIKHSDIKPGWEALNNTSVAFLNGWKILEQNVPKTAEITKVNSPSQLFNLLKLNRVDYIIYEKWGGLALAKSMKIENVNALSPPLAVRHLHMYLHNKHATHISPLTDALTQLKADGTYQSIFRDTLESLPNKP